MVTEVTLPSKSGDPVLPPSSYRSFGKGPSLDLSSLICEVGEQGTN